MNSFAVSHGFAADGKNCPREFSIIENRLRENEDVVFTFTAKKVTDHNGTVLYPGTAAFALSEERFLISGKNSCRSFPLENFSDFTVGRKGIFSKRKMTLNFFDGSLSFTVDDDAADELCKILDAALNLVLKDLHV